MEQKILDYLATFKYPISTRIIARNVVFKERYDESDAYYNGRATVQPGKDAVSGTYYFLNKLQKSGKIKQYNRSTWMISKDE